MARTDADPIIVRSPAWFSVLILVGAGIGGWFGLGVLSSLQSGEPFDLRHALLGVASPGLVGFFLYLVGLVIEIDEREVVARWCGYPIKSFETRSLRRVEVVVNAWKLHFEGGGSLQLNRHFDNGGAAVTFLSLLLEAKEDTADEEEAPPSRRARASKAPKKPSKTSKKPRAVGRTASLPLLHLCFPDECLACGGEAAFNVDIDIESRTLLQRLSGTFTEATVSVPACADCGARHGRLGWVHALVWLGLVAQLVASVKWETHPVLVAVGVALPTLWFFNSNLFERWKNRFTLRVEALSLDPARGEVKLRFVDPRRASEVAALTEAQRAANLAAAEELLESGVG
jgi:hypothetical protein